METIRTQPVGLSAERWSPVSQSRGKILNYDHVPCSRKIGWDQYEFRNLIRTEPTIRRCRDVEISRSEQPEMQFALTIFYSDENTKFLMIFLLNVLYSI